MSNNNKKKEACGLRAVNGTPGVKGMGGEDIKKFIKEHGTDAAKEALRGSKTKSRGEMCVILHSFHAGRVKIAESGAMSNFRLTPSPNRSSSSSSNSNKSPPRFVAPVGMSKEQEKKFWKVVPKNFGKSSSPPNMRSNIERMLNNFMTSEQNRKALQKALSGNKPMKREKIYMSREGVKILGKRPTSEQIKAALMQKNHVVGKAGSSSSSSSSNRRSNRNGNGSSSNTGSSNKSANSLVTSKSGSSSSNRNINSNFSGGNNNSGGSNRGNGINRSHYQNLTAKRNKVVKVRQTGSRRTGKKKNMSGPFCLLNPTNSACRKMSLRKNNFFRVPVGKGGGTRAPVRHGGIKSSSWWYGKPVTFMNVPNVGNKNVMNPTARIRPRPIGFHYTPGSKSKLTKNQLRLANNERWRRYANMTKNMVFNTKEVYGKLKPNTEAEQRSALANKLYMEVIKNIKAGKISAAPPRRKLSRKLSRKRPTKVNQEKMMNMKLRLKVKSELGKMFSKSYMTGHQVEPYYKPSKKKKKNNNSNSGNKKNVNINED